MRKNILIIFVCFVLTSNIFASNDYSVEIINTTSELPVANISRIFFGQDGLLWIATNKGLFYFDGYSYFSLFAFFFNSNSLSNDNIIDITQDKNGDIWLLTKHGVEKFNVRKRKPESILYLPNLSSSASILHSPIDSVLFIGSENAILKLDIRTQKIDTLYRSDQFMKCSPILIDNYLWFVGENRLTKINIFDNTINEIEFEPLSLAKTTTLQYLKDNNILLATDNIIYTYNIESNIFTQISNFPNFVLHISEVKNNKFLIATINEIFLCELSDSISFKVELLKTIKDATIKSITLDKNGFAWVATNKSILSINPYSKEFNYKTFLEGKFNFPIGENIIFESTKSGAVFKTTNNKYCFFQASNNKFYDLPIPECTAACMYNDELFLGLSDKLVKFNLKTNMQTNIFTDLHVNSIKTLDEFLWVAADEGLYVYEHDTLNLICSLSILDFLVKDDVFYIITEDGFGQIHKANCNYELLIQGKSLKAGLRLNDILQSYDGNTWIATDNGLFQFIPDSTKDIKNQFKLHYKGAVYALIEAEELPEVWYSTDIGLGAIDYSTGEDMFFGYPDGVKQTSYLVKGAFHGKNSNLVFVTGKQTVQFQPKKIFRRKSSPDVIISTARFVSKKGIEESLFYNSDTIILLPNISYFELELTTLDYFSPESTKYKYSLEPIGHDLNWREVKNKNKFAVGRLSAGKYNLNIKAINNHGVESQKYRRLIIIVKAPLLHSRLAYFGYFIVLIFMVFLLIRIRTRNLRRINLKYKENELIANEVRFQKEELSQKNKNIMDSINYARRIQLAMMPSVKLFSAVFPDSFVMHLPKDIVSGDFYWINQVEDKTFFSAVDCTGHGVPGAFMSIIGVELFRRITEIEGISTPAEVLNSLSRNFERVFGDVDEMKLRDGMDLAFCTINSENTVLEFSGAFNPLYIIRDSSIMEIKGDRHSVGIYDEDDNVRSFNNHVIPLHDGDIIYIFTDGFADQFGGPEGKKYKYRRFRHLLLALHQLPMEKQEDFLRKSILEWKGELDQVDDILVMGLRVIQKPKK